MTSPDELTTGDLPASVGVIGVGRFGLLWARSLQADFAVLVHDPDPERAAQAARAGLTVAPLRDVLAADAIFYCVPISSLEAVLKEHLPLLAQREKPATLIDMLSVKLYPRAVFDRGLPEPHQAMLTHPMFGPDSVTDVDIAGQTIVVDQYRVTEPAFNAWVAYFESRGLRVVVMSADEHDRLAAESQGVTHFVGRVLERFAFRTTPIDTPGARRLHELTGQVANDTWQLFVDLQTRNPYTRALRVRLSAAQDAVFDQLLPNRVTSDRLVVGIQGGRGSFNEEAAHHYLNRTSDQAFELIYLHTTEDVLRALHEGEVDRGQFAIHNSVGGVVEESVQAMARYRFAIVEEFAITIAHALLIASAADLSAVDTVMSHPQVLSQCRATLASKYPGLRQVSGDGELIDHAKVAELLGDGRIPPTVATLGSRTLADLHPLTIVEDNLQDMENNLTSFLWVQRPGERAPGDEYVAARPAAIC
ncbi:MAG: prephenate dehydrogenase/arogenate dehydrogenase family protein [Candidatus Dormibacteria bacterium]